MKKLFFAFILGLSFCLNPVSAFACESDEPCVEVFASYEDGEVTPAAAYVTCPGCAEYTCTKTQTYGSWSLHSLITCSHGLSGYDNKYVRNVTVTYKCGNCGYNSSSTTKQYKTVCAGVN